MARWIVFLWMALGGLLLGHPPALACSICGGGLQSGQSFRENAAKADLVLLGTLSNPQLKPNADLIDASGTTDLIVEKVFKPAGMTAERKVVVLPRYVPVDAKNPTKFMVFCAVYKDKAGQTRIDPYQGFAVPSAAIPEYLQGILALDPRDRMGALLYYFRHLDHADPLIADDAFLEFFKASDQEIGQLAGKLPADKLRRWLQDSKMPVVRVGLYAFLLAACGDDRDASLLRALLDGPAERARAALEGILAGYIQLRPREGWQLAQAMLGDRERPFLERMAVVRMLRFYHAWKPEETRVQVLSCQRVALDQGDLADLAIEDLRRWQDWDLTTEVLAQFGKKSHDAPIMRRAILRYALSCPTPEARGFATTVRQADPELVKDVEMSLQFEKRN